MPAPKKGLLTWAVLAWLAALEPVSLLTSRIPPCLIDTASYDTYYADNKECPAFHVFLIKLLTIVLEKLGDPAWATVAATIAIAAFTGTLWWSTKGMLKATNDSIALARAEFLSSHRPRMRLKHMWLIDQLAWRLGGPFELNLDIVNVGNTPGFITWINFDSALLPPDQRLPQRPPYDEFSGDPDLRITRFRTNTELQSGVTLYRNVCDGQIFTPDEVKQILWGERRLYLFGTIEYVDRTGIRQTGFCRRFTYERYPPDSMDMGRFKIVKDPDYEFED
jgi:hypothetical protein